MPTFKVQGQIYHLDGSLLPFSNAYHKFMETYFMGNTNNQIDRYCPFNTNTKRIIVATLQTLFDHHNELIRLFRNALDQIIADDYKIVVRTDNIPI